MTVTTRVTEPIALAAVSVYVVVVAGLTETLDPVTTPTPWSMLIVPAPATLHERTVDCPAWRDAGEAVNDAMIGGAAAGQVVAGCSKLTASTSMTSGFHSHVSVWISIALSRARSIVPETIHPDPPPRGTVICAQVVPSLGT